MPALGIRYQTEHTSEQTMKLATIVKCQTRAWIATRYRSKTLVRIFSHRSPTHGHCTSEAQFWINLRFSICTVSMPLLASTWRIFRCRPKSAIWSSLVHAV